MLMTKFLFFFMTFTHTKKKKLLFRLVFREIERTHVSHCWPAFSSSYLQLLIIMPKDITGIVYNINIFKYSVAVELNFFSSMNMQQQYPRARSYLVVVAVLAVAVTLLQSRHVVSCLLLLGFLYVLQFAVNCFVFQIRIRHGIEFLIWGLSNIPASMEVDFAIFWYECNLSQPYTAVLFFCTFCAIGIHGWLSYAYKEYET